MSNVSFLTILWRSIFFGGEERLFSQDEHYYRPVLTDMVITDGQSILTSYYSKESLCPLCNLIAIAVSNVCLLALPYWDHAI